jgi:hypothetical protein
MQIDRRLVGFGLFLITIGGVMVAVRQGLIAEETAREAWTLWPLILIGVGLSIVLAGRPGAAIGGLVLAVTFGAMLGGVAATGVFPGGGVCGGDGGDRSAFPNAGGNLGQSGRVEISQDCGDLTIGTVEGSTWSVSGSSVEGRPPQVETSGDRLRITTPDDGPFDLGGSGDWTVVLPRAGPIDLDVTVNGGQSRFALGGARLGSQIVVEPALTASSAEKLRLGRRRVAEPKLTSIVASPTEAACLPSGAGLRVELDSVAASAIDANAGSIDLDLRSNDFADHGLIESNGSWQTPGFGSAEIRIDLKADVNAGSLALNPDRTCAG